MWLTLVWKEWHEHKWKLLSLTVIAMSVFLVCTWEDYTYYKDGLFITTIGYSLLAPTFVGMTVCASEFSRRTIPFIAAQPVPMWKVATTRLIAGAAVLLIPIFVTHLYAWLYAVFNTSEGYNDVGYVGTVPPAMQIVFGVVMSLNLYAWIVAIAVNQRTELRAGLIGIVVTAVLVVTGIVGLSAWDNVHHGVSLPGFLALISGPICGFGWYDMARQPSRAPLIWPTVIWQGLLITVLSVLMIGRYGQSEPWPMRWAGRWHARALPGGVIRQPFRSPTKALLWMQWRQSIPVCVAGTVLMVLTAIFATGINPNYMEVVELLCGAAVLLATALSLLLGTVGFTNDLEAKLYTFWRSRPISPAKWFWLRYVAGLAAILVFFIVPTAIFGFGMMVFGLGYFVRPILSFSGLSFFGLRFMFLLIPLVSLVVYSLGVFFGSSVRHPVYSIILAVCAALLMLFVPTVFTPLNAVSIFELLDQAGRMSQDGRLGAALGCLFGAVALAGGISTAATIAAATMVNRDVYLRT